MVHDIAYYNLYLVSNYAYTNCHQYNKNADNTCKDN